ncbi:helix-turn-helix domain-containing protein [Paenibacillus lentus]|uniref:helix-turn-helix domain-containing protein n=1 Tax=Paenibacillus lentus TaxID=1338368 RepID=UPI00365972CA
MKKELFDLVYHAQNGDREALYQIIVAFTPAITGARQKVKYDRQEDLEQSIIEIVIKKILSYDLDQVPDFSKFSSLFTNLERVN